ncbi:MAG: hypothetical protein A1D16_00295 [Flavihumibacter sp. CACIAM 22H1]|nr:MAG: hypothetical protein A1D16_00295 [Flavihumibacter sp. CACIAM 22H1]
MSCIWITKDKAVVPMEIEPLFCYIETETAEKIRQLIRLKATVGEKYLHQKDELHEWAKDKLALLDKAKEEYLGVSQAGMHSLNDFFIQMLERSYDTGAGKSQWMAAV